MSRDRLAEEVESRNRVYVERDTLKTVLAASQAHARELRAALSICEGALRTYTIRDRSDPFASRRRAEGLDAAQIALARESSTDALREFGLKVANECFRQASVDSVVDGWAAVDVVLKGDAT